MVGISEMTDAELVEILNTCAAGDAAYICAMDELGFRERHPEYRVA
jgi:hypothetical protein